MTGGSGEPFEIHWAVPARRALRRLPEKAATAAVEFVYGPLAANPGRVGRPLRFELEGLCTAPTGATTGSCTGSTTGAGGSRSW